MFNVFYLRRRKNRRVAVPWFLLSCLAPMSALGQPQGSWMLEDSIRRVVEIAPETRGAQAAVSARQGALEQAGVWPNPPIELRADDKIGKEEGSGGTDFTQFAISQPLPLSGRLGHQQAAAGAALEAARAERRYQQARLETQVAQRYRVDSHSARISQAYLQTPDATMFLRSELERRFPSRGPIRGHLHIELIAPDGAPFKEAATDYKRMSVKSRIAMFQLEIPAMPANVKIRACHSS